MTLHVFLLCLSQFQILSGKLQAGLRKTPELTSFFQVIVATKFVKVTHSLSVRSGGETDGP